MHSAQTPPSIALLTRSEYFLEYRDALVGGFRRFGWQAVTAQDTEEVDARDCYLVIGIHLYPDISVPKHSKLFGIQTEQLPTPRVGTHWVLNRNYRVFAAVAGHYDLIFDWSLDHYEYLSRRINCRYLPYGCRLSETNTNVEECYDILFLGAPNERRRVFLSALAEHFALFPPGYGLWGEAKRDAILKSRICLNLHQVPCPCFEAMRIYDYLSMKKCVISESIVNPFPFQPGRDFISCNGVGDLVDAVANHLLNEHARRRIAEHGYDTARLHGLNTCVSMIISEIRREIAIDRPAWKKRSRLLLGKARLALHTGRKRLSSIYRTFRADTS